MVKVFAVDVTEVECHKFVTEASTIGLPPGRYPLMMETSLGNGLPLEFVARLPADERSFGAAKYRQCNGCIEVIVLND